MPREKTRKLEHEATFFHDGKALEHAGSQYPLRFLRFHQMANPSQLRLTREHVQRQLLLCPARADRPGGGDWWLSKSCFAASLNIASVSLSVQDDSARIVRSIPHALSRGPADQKGRKKRVITACSGVIHEPSAPARVPEMLVAN